MRKSLHPQESDADDDRICIRNYTAGRFSADDSWLARSSAFAESSVNRPGTPPRVGPPAWNEARRTASPYIAPNPPLGSRWAILARVSTRPEKIRHRQRQGGALLSDLRKSAIDHGARKGSNAGFTRSSSGQRWHVAGLEPRQPTPRRGYSKCFKKMYLMTFPPDGFAQTTKDSLNSHDAQSLQEFLKQSDASPVSRVPPSPPA